MSEEVKSLHFIIYLLFKEFLDWQRKQMKQGEEPLPVIPTHDDPQNFLKPTTAQTQRLSHTTPLQGLRKMIENSKLLSKINICKYLAFLFPKLFSGTS